MLYNPSWTRHIQQPAGSTAPFTRIVPMRSHLARQALLLAPALLASLYLLGIFGWWAASTRFGDRWLWLFVLNNLAVYLFLPLPLALIVALLVPNLPLRLGAALALVLFVSLYGRLFLPRPPAPPANPTLTVMTYNVLAFNPRPDAVAEAIARSGADVVALQEVSEPIAAVLRERLREQYPYHALARTDGVRGMGVWSRYPLRDTGQRLAGPWLSEPQVLEVAHPEVTVTLINVHNVSLDVSSPGWWRRLHHTAPAREAAARSLIAFARANEGPLVVLGDFNATDQSRVYRMLGTALRDAWREAGFGLGHTFPGTNARGVGPPRLGARRLPRWLARIDYVFHSPDLKTLEARIGPWDGGSDHRPVLARLDLAPERRATSDKGSGTSRKSVSLEGAQEAPVEALVRRRSRIVGSSFRATSGSNSLQIRPQRNRLP